MQRYNPSDIPISGKNDNDISVIHYFSAFSGPILAVALTTFVCFMPYHNAMEEPEYWYEFHFLVQVFLPFHIGSGMLYGRYFANFTYDNLWKSYLILYGLGWASYLVSTVIYYWVWTNILGHYAPMAWTYYMALFFPISTAFFGSWYR